MSFFMSNFCPLAVLLSLSCFTGIAIAQPKPASAPAKKTSFGLGVPRNSGIGGAVRTGIDASCPRIALLSPATGARTLSAKPTIFWYVEYEPTNKSEAVPLNVTFILRDRDDRTAARVFAAQGQLKGSGLYGFTLPPSAPNLVAGKVQRWDIRLQVPSCNDLPVASAAILLEPNAQVEAAANKAKDDLGKARIYVSQGYWVEALAAYDRWLTANKGDAAAKQERNAMIDNGFKEYDALDNESLKPLLVFVKTVPSKIISTTSQRQTLMPMVLESVN
jgi:hypothetical protein